MIKKKRSRSKSISRAKRRAVADAHDAQDDAHATMHYCPSTPYKLDHKGFLPLPDHTFTKPRKLFAKYYKSQNLVPHHAWARFEAALIEPLPITFRMTHLAPPAYRARAAPMLRRLNALHYQRLDAYQLPHDKDTLRWSARSHSDESELRRWLIEGTDAGWVVRQELASMLPPHLLSPGADALVLDMCASPGSKTTQVGDIMQRRGSSSGVAISGLIVANDADRLRSYTLAKRCAGLGDAAGSVLVTCHQAQRFPSTEHVAAGGYTHIICDVPCSGDGTTRKHFEVFKRWEPLMGLRHHSMQLAIAMRGAALLAVGGTMVYSTCSFNPIENESVVAELVRRCGGAIVIDDAHAPLADVLPTAPGLLTWRVLSSALEAHGDCATARAAHTLYNAERQLFQPSMWPPAVEESRRIGLDRCARLVPSESNTGGFFVALLRKVAPLPRAPLRSLRPAADPVAERALARRAHSAQVCNEPLQPLPPTIQLSARVGLEPADRAALDAATQLFVRSQNARTVFFVSPSAYQLSRDQRLRVVRAGTAVLRRRRIRANMADAEWRLTEEGAAMLKMRALL